MSPPSVPPAIALHLGEFLPPLGACALYVGLYVRRARHVWREHGLATWRISAFVAGVTLVTAVQLPPLDDIADRQLAAHMVQHIILGDIASLLIVFGLTGPMLVPLLRNSTTRRLRALVTPFTALALWAIDLYAWHLPALYQLAVRHDIVHAAEHACFLWFGMLLWFALLGPLPKPAWFDGWGGLGYVAGVRLIGAVLANVLIWTQSLLYPVYAATDRAGGRNPLSDQSLAGGVMMFEQIVLTTVLLGWLFLRLQHREGERQSLLDMAARSGAVLSEERAARAASAGASARLHERLAGEGAGAAAKHRSSSAPIRPPAKRP